MVLTPQSDAPDGLHAELHGDLAMILAMVLGLGDKPTGTSGLPKKAAQGGAAGSLLSVVAGIGFEPMTFRL